MTAVLAKHRCVDRDRKPLGYDAYWFFCPGCESPHQYLVGAGSGPRWDFNGDMQLPTFTPSLLNTAPGRRCHLFVTEGKLHFCSDCDHKLAGQVVDLPVLPEWMR